jgi:hypothetical protein
MIKQFSVRQASGLIRLFRPAFCLLPALFLCFSCTDFFSTSLAPWAARDPSKLVPAVTTGNVDELIALAENNPDLSLEVLKKIKAAAENASPEDKAKLQAAALEAAVNASGLAQSVLNNAGEISSIANADDAKKLVLDAVNSMSNLEEAGSLLNQIIPAPADPLHPEDDPAFTSFTDNASVDELAMAAVVLMAGEAKQTVNSGGTASLEDYIDSVDPANPTGSQELAVAMALAATVATRADELSGPMRDALKGLNLIS